MIWRIEVRVTRTDTGPTVADGTVEATGADAYRKLAAVGIALVRHAVDMALRQG